MAKKRTYDQLIKNNPRVFARSSRRDRRLNHDSISWDDDDDNKLQNNNVDDGVTDGTEVEYSAKDDEDKESQPELMLTKKQVKENQKEANVVDTSLAAKRVCEHNHPDEPLGCAYPNDDYALLEGIDRDTPMTTDQIILFARREIGVPVKLIYAYTHAKGHHRAEPPGIMTNLMKHPVNIERKWRALMGASEKVFEAVTWAAKKRDHDEIWEEFYIELKMAQAVQENAAEYSIPAVVAARDWEL